MGYFLAVTAALLGAVCVYGAPRAETIDDATGHGRLDGRYLLELGADFNNPLVRLLGRALITREQQLEALRENLTEKVEADTGEIVSRLCEIDPCTEWSAWSNCPVYFKGQFSMVVRTRECGLNTSLCTFPAGASYTTQESKICEGNISTVCPSSYSTVAGFCVKLYKENRPQTSAVAQCQADGGHLANLNTRAKNDALQTFLKENGAYSNSVWIDGSVNQSTADWVYVNGPAPDFNGWRSSEPNGGSSYPYCRDAYQGGWDDDPCSTGYYFLCEMTLS